MSVHWADQLAEQTIDRFPDKDRYTVSSGISPSGTVHVGNFREIITTHLVAEALRRKGEEVRFIYSWDDYDRFRKVPENVPDEHEKFKGLPLRDVPDHDGCHSSYAEHFEQKLEAELDGLGIEPQFIRQAKMFRDCRYSDLIKQSLENQDQIREILNRYRSEDLEEEWIPVNLYCRECGKDFMESLSYEGGYEIHYICSNCGKEETINFNEEDSVKPPWRVDWPMRWKFEDVKFEPAGKEHSADTGSRDTANDLSREIFGITPPVHQMYEFVTKDGSKISASKGKDTFSLTDLKSIYTPRMIRFLFAGTRPSAAFEIPFESEEILQRYQEFDQLEQKYFDGHEVEGSEKNKEHLKRVYELSCLDIPSESVSRVDFKHAAVIAQVIDKENWENQGIEKLKQSGHLPENPSEREIDGALERMSKAYNWARNYGPEKYRFKIGSEYEFSENEHEAAEILIEKLEGKIDSSTEEIDECVFDAKDNSNLGTGEFFDAMYLKLLGKDHGPRLSTLISTMNREQVRRHLLG